jgi:hypothetical protein
MQFLYRNGNLFVCFFWRIQVCEKWSKETNLLIATDTTGTDFSNFLPKHLAKNLAFLIQNTPNFRRISIIASVFKKNAIFSRKIAVNREKLP